MRIAEIDQPLLRDQITTSCGCILRTGASFALTDTQRTRLAPETNANGTRHLRCTQRPGSAKLTDGEHWTRQAGSRHSCLDRLFDTTTTAAVERSKLQIHIAIEGFRLHQQRCTQS